MDAGYVVGIVGGISAIIFGFIAFMRNNRQDNRMDAKQEGVILTELGYIKGGVEDIKLEQREQRKTINDVIGRIAMLETKVDRAHTRIDRIEKHEDTKQSN